MCWSIDADIDVEDGIGSNPAAKGDGNGAARWYSSGESRNLNGFSVRICISKGVGVDSRCSEEDSSRLKQEYITFNLNNKGWIKYPGQLNSQCDILNSRHIIFHGSCWRISLGCIESQYWSITYCLKRNKQLSYLEWRY